MRHDWSLKLTAKEKLESRNSTREKKIKTKVWAILPFAVLWAEKQKCDGEKEGKG